MYNENVINVGGTAYKCELMATSRMLQSLKAFRLIRSVRCTLFPCDSKVYNRNIRSHCLQWRTVSCNSICRIDVDVDEISTKQQKKKSVPIPKITLLHPDDTMIVCTLEEAQKLAKRRMLQLVKEDNVDHASKRPIYKLYSTNSIKYETNKDRKPSKEQKKSKSMKVIQLAPKISKHDFDIKIKNIIRLLNKKCEVKVIVSQSENKENVVKAIKDTITENGEITEVYNKSSSVVMHIVPLSTNNKNSETCTETIDTGRQSSNKDQ